MAKFQSSDVYKSETLPEPGQFHALDLLFRTIRCLGSKVSKSSFMNASFTSILEYSCAVYRSLYEWMETIDQRGEMEWADRLHKISAIEILENVLLKLTRQVEGIPSRDATVLFDTEDEKFSVSDTLKKLTFFARIREVVIGTVNEIKSSAVHKTIHAFPLDTAEVYLEYYLHILKIRIDTSSDPTQTDAELIQLYENITSHMVAIVEGEHKRTKNISSEVTWITESIIHPLQALIQILLHSGVSSKWRKETDGVKVRVTLTSTLEYMDQNLVKSNDFTEKGLMTLMEKYEDTLNAAIPKQEREAVPTVSKLLKSLLMVQRPFHLQALAYIDCLHGLIEKYDTKKTNKRRLALELAIKSAEDALLNASMGFDEDVIAIEHNNISIAIFLEADEALIECFNAFDNWFKRHIRRGESRKYKHTEALLRARAKDKTALQEFINKSNCWKRPAAEDSGEKTDTDTASGTQGQSSASGRNEGDEKEEKSVPSTTATTGGENPTSTESKA